MKTVTANFESNTYHQTIIVKTGVIRPMVSKGIDLMNYLVDCVIVQNYFERYIISKE